MIRPERVGVEPHGAAGDEPAARAWSSGRSSSAARTSCTCASLGGDLLKAMVAERRQAAGVALEQGEAVSLHLPADGLRVLTSEPKAEPEPEAPSS